MWPRKSRVMSNKTGQVMQSTGKVWLLSKQSLYTVRNYVNTIIPSPGNAELEKDKQKLDC